VIKAQFFSSLFQGIFPLVY